MKEQIIEKKGWYCNENNKPVLIDKYIILGERLQFHCIKKEDGENIDLWDVVCSSGEAPRLYNTPEECKASEEDIRNFEKAKYKASEQSRMDKLIAALKEYDDDEYADFEDVLKEAGYYYYKTSHENNESKYEKVANIYRDGFIRFSDTRLRISDVESIERTNTKITINCASGKTFTVVDNDENHILVAALKFIFCF